MSKHKAKQKTLDLTAGVRNVPESPTHRIIHGDVLVGLESLPDGSVDCAVTSPPYWSQRDYGFEHQIGNEETLDEYLGTMIAVYEVLRQKLHPRGVFFHNIGDKYLNKYGNTPLGMIPYLLTYHMIQAGWTLVDIIIWYKPNHMPSSVKNRFTNTYEPVFVLARSPDNYYQTFRKSREISNILRIPLQQISYAHMATYPERLVEELLARGVPKTGLVLDPFAGSGTTCKAAQNLSQAGSWALKTISIEAQAQFVSIIMDRCGLARPDVIHLKGSSRNLAIELQSFTPPNPVSSPCSEILGINDQNLPVPQLLHFFETDEEFERFSPYLFDEDFTDTLEDDGIFFLGLVNHKIEHLFLISQAPDWVIRNMLVIPSGYDWIPVFMLVKDIKTTRYKFNLDAIRVDHQHADEEDWQEVDFTGYRVTRSLNYFKEPSEGIIVEVISRRESGFPTWVVVKWELGEISYEEIINPPVPERRVVFQCPRCEEVLQKAHHPRKEVTCHACGLELWHNLESIPHLILNPRTPPELNLNSLDSHIIAKETTPDYNGKFKDAERINLGQSPGARASVSEQYFSTQRYYNVRQSLICDYLNLYRVARGFSKKALTELFPPSYRHTVGHWLRKDMGGSLPKPEDLARLREILGLDEIYCVYMTRMGIKLQTVLPDAKGKNPGDFLQHPLPIVVRMLQALGEY